MQLVIINLATDERDLFLESGAVHMHAQHQRWEVSNIYSERYSELSEIRQLW